VGCVEGGAPAVVEVNHNPDLVLLEGLAHGKDIFPCGGLERPASCKKPIRKHCL
jgi:hypothetical protein